MLQFLLLILASVGLVTRGFCQNRADEVTAVYIVTVKQAPSAHIYFDELNKKIGQSKNKPSSRLDTLHRRRYLSLSLSLSLF